MSRFGSASSLFSVSYSHAGTQSHDSRASKFVADTVHSVSYSDPAQPVLKASFAIALYELHIPILTGPEAVTSVVLDYQVT